MNILKTSAKDPFIFDAYLDPGAALEKMDPDPLKFIEFFNKPNFQTINSIKSKTKKLNVYLLHQIYIDVIRKYAFVAKTQILNKTNRLIVIGLT